MEKINKGIMIFTVGFFGAAIIAIIVMIYIAIAHGTEMKKIIAEQATKTVVRVGMGGDILDDNNAYLAYYSPTFKAAWDTDVANRFTERLEGSLKKEQSYKVKDENRISKLKTLFEFNSTDSLIYYMDANFKNKNRNRSFESKINTAYNKKSTYNLITDGNVFADIDLMRTFPYFNLPQFSGGFLVTENFRVDFLNKSVTGRTLGQEMYLDTIRKQGLVYAYNDVLMGETKIFDIERSKKSYKPKNIGEDFIPANGRDIVSTLNYEISEFAYTALMKQMKRTQAKRGCVVVMDVSTGDIKAMVSLVNNNGAYLHSENVAVKHVYEPGSVFKLASFMVAMNDGLIDWDRKYDIGFKRSKTVGPRVINEYDTPRVSPLDPKEIFARSSNIGTCMLIWNLYGNQQQKFIDGLKKMHIGEMTEIEIEGEGKAFLKDTKTTIPKKEWWKVSLVQIAYGYEVEITPLQLATFYNAIANNGIYVKPRLVTSITGNKLHKAQSFPVNFVDTICTPEVAAKATEILVEAAHEGTGKNVFKNASYKFAGKTGTAQYFQNHNASFVGYFPAEKPMYTVCVLISEPANKQYGYTGGMIAAPVAKEIADKISATDRRLFEEITIDSSTSKVWDKIEKLKNNE